MTTFGSSTESGTLVAGSMIWPLRLAVQIERGPPRKKLILISGPTACGKTALSLALADGINAEIVAADSMQVYRGMDIGTAKPTPEELAKVPHHLIDVRDVSRPFNVVDFYYESLQAIEKIHERGAVPIVVGGAGFYLHTLLYGPPEGPPSIPAVRRALEEEMERVGCEEMYRRLQRQDPLYAESITHQDRHKIIRALEIIQLTGERVSSLSWKSRNLSLNYDLCSWFLIRPREVLYRRVEDRCDEMLGAGLLDEVRRLEQEGLRENRSASQAIGYRQALEHIDGLYDYDEFVERFKRASRRYIKRQLTWFRHEPIFQWINLEDYDQELLVEKMIRECL